MINYLMGRYHIGRFTWCMLWTIGMIYTLKAMATNWRRYTQYSSIIDQQNYDNFESKVWAEIQ